MQNGSKDEASRKTVLTISVGLLVIHFITGKEWPVITSLIVGMAGLISNALAIKIDYVWTALTKFVGALLQRVVLTVIFYALLFPLALAARFFGKRDPLQLSNNRTSTFQTVEKTFAKETFEKPW